MSLKQITAIGVLFFAGLTLYGLSTVQQALPNQRSAFYVNFEGAALVKLSLPPETPVGCQSYGYSDEGANWNGHWMYHRVGRCDLSLPRGSDNMFMTDLKIQLNNALKKQQVRKLGSGGSGDESFYAAYTDEKIHGIVDVIAMRGEGDKYSLTFSIKEGY